MRERAGATVVMPCKSQLVSKVRYNKLLEFHETNTRKRGRTVHGARLSGGTKNYALTRDSTSRYFGASDGRKIGGKKGKNRRLLGNPLCMKTSWKMSFLRISLIKTRSERTKERHVLSSLSGILISEFQSLDFGTQFVFFSTKYPHSARKLRDTSQRNRCNKYNSTEQFGIKTMTNSSRPRELNQVASRVYARQTFSKTSAQSMRNTNDTRNWNSEIGDDLPIGSKAGTRRAGCAAISGSVFSDRFATPFLAVAAQRLAQHSTSAGIPSIPSLCSPRPVTLVRSGTPRVQFYCLCCSSVTETRAREEQTARRRTKRRGRSGERPTSKWILIVLL